MSAKKVTRRQATSQLIQATLFTAAIPQFLLAQTTSPQKSGAAGQEAGNARNTAQGTPPPAASERVVISGVGSVLTFTIVGPPGRHCKIVYAEVGTGRYRMARGAKGVIGPNGRLTLNVNVSSLGSRRLLFRVGTSPSPAFDRDMRGTDPFEVGLEEGVVSKLPSKHALTSLSTGPQAAASTVGTE